MSGVATAIVGGALVGGYMASESQKSSAGTAAAAQRDAAAQSAEVQWKMYNQSRDDTAGQRELFDQASPYLSQYARGADRLADQYTRELNALQSPTQSTFDNDPLYQAQQAEAMRQLNRRSAAGGKMYSSDADNAVARNSLSFMQDSYNRKYGNIMDRYGLESQADSTGYNRYLDMAKIGSGAAAAAGQNSMEVGRNMGQTYTQAGDASAQASLAGGQANAQMWNTIGNAPMNAMSAYNMYQQPSQMPYTYGNALSSAQAPTGQYNIGQWGTTAYGM